MKTLSPRSISIMLTTLVIALLLGGCCNWCKRHCPDLAERCFGDESDPFLHAYQGSCTDRTWTVTDAGGRDNLHFVYGGSFKIARFGEDLSLTPLAGLRQAWNITDPDFSIELERIEGGEQPTLCGTVELVNHPSGEATKHYLLLTMTDSNNMKIEYEIFDPAVPNQCSRRRSHGGVAHAEN